ncbi:MAG: tetratricopeptide repeat protein [Gammaproteobacteria bacterium]|nr:tetratricopeptide repeat protein [Gammaproteobacteria bacterium]MDH3468155.1 tetratricopeptide repeat protein [Gammaproteobacteria bacterium]
MDPRFSDDEQLEKLKSWWHDNRWSIITGLVLGLSVVVGWNGWQQYTTSRAESASVLYERMLTADAAANLDAAEALASELIRDYGNSGYAGKAALLSAKLASQRGDYTAAAERLRWIIVESGEPGMVHVAQLRLGRVLIAAGDYAQAESVLNVADRGAFESQYAELLGDAYGAQNHLDKARNAYTASLDALPPSSSYRPILSMKLHNIAAE